MRNRFYNYNGWFKDSGMVPRDWKLEQGPVPYGEVPENWKEKPEKEAPRVPPSRLAVPENKRAKKKEKTPKPKKSRKPSAVREKNGTGGFCLMLLLLLVLTGTAVGLQGRIMPGEAPFKQFWDELPNWNRYYEVAEANDWVKDLEKTTIPRAKLGDGTVLPLVSNDGTSLTPQEIYARVNPAVVGIRAIRDSGMYLGTGVIMSEDGYIITNAHVIAGTQRASVIFSDNTQAEALLVGYDGESDLAVLKVERENLVAAEFGDSAQLQVGDPAYAIGNPLGEELRGTMTSGIISAIDRTVDMNGQSMTLIQTNAALNSGNSGGALINSAGQVVGITNMKMMSEWETIEGLGFAVPSVMTKAVVDQIIATGSYIGRPGLGINVLNHYDTDGNPDGVEVFSVKEGSGAEGKLFAGDVIVTAQGQPVLDTNDLLRIKDWMTVGETLNLQVRTENGGDTLIEVPVVLKRSRDLNDSKDLTTRRNENT